MSSRIVGLFLAVLIVAASPAHSSEYVNLKHRFSLDLPEGWRVDAGSRSSWISLRHPLSKEVTAVLKIGRRATRLDWYIVDELRQDDLRNFRRKFADVASGPTSNAARRGWSVKQYEITYTKGTTPLATRFTLFDAKAPDEDAFSCFLLQVQYPRSLSSAAGTISTAVVDMVRMTSGAEPAQAPAGGGPIEEVRARASATLCCRTRALIRRAVGLYRQDTTRARITLDRAFLKSLVARHYLQEMPTHPGGGSDSAGSFTSDDDGVTVRCRIHGGGACEAALNRPPPGEAPVEASGQVDTPVVTYWVEALNDPAERRVALEAIGQIGPAARRAVPRLIKMLETVEPIDMSLEFDLITRALGRLGPGAAPQLAKALQQGAEPVRLGAARAFTVMAGVPGPYLRELLLTLNGPNPFVAREALKALEPREGETPKFLLEARKDPEPGVRGAADSALRLLCFRSQSALQAAAQKAVLAGRTVPGELTQVAQRDLVESGMLRSTHRCFGCDDPPNAYLYVASKEGRGHVSCRYHGPVQGGAAEQTGGRPGR